MKKVLLVLLALLLVTTLVGCSGEPKTGDDGKEKIIIGFVTDTGGLGDQGFNDAVHSGAVKLADELGIELKIVESKEINDYANNMRALFNDGATVVICAGASFADAITQVASEFPDKHFVVSDAEVDGIANVSSSVFREEEAAYVLGAFAGLVTKSNKAGYIGGVESPLQERAMVGFEAGFKNTNPNGEVTSVYTNTYSDVGKGKETANVLYKQGADYVATFAGACNLGAFQSATDAGEGNYVLGAALGQFDKNPEKIIASQVKTVDKSIYNALKEFVEGNFVAGVVSRGIAEGGVDIMFNPNTELVNSILSEEDMKKVEEIRQLVIDGKIDIPLTKAELGK